MLHIDTEITEWTDGLVNPGEHEGNLVSEIMRYKPWNEGVASSEGRDLGPPGEVRAAGLITHISNSMSFANALRTLMIYHSLNIRLYGTRFHSRSQSSSPLLNRTCRAIRWPWMGF